MEDAELAGLHDAFAFLLEEIDHDDLAYSLAIESNARDVSAVEAHTAYALASVEAQMNNSSSTASADHGLPAMSAGAPFSSSSISSGMLASAAQWFSQGNAQAQYGASFPQQLPPGLLQQLPPGLLQQLPLELVQQLPPELQQQLALFTMRGSANGAGAAHPSVESFLERDNVMLTPLPVHMSGDETVDRVAASPGYMRSDSSANYDTDDEASGSSHQAESAAPSQVQPRKPMENSTRKRQKEELAYLRDKVLELEAELKSMQQRARMNGGSTSRRVIHEKKGEADDQSETSSSSPLPSSPARSAADTSSTSSSSSLSQNHGLEETKSAAAVAVVPVSKVSLWERVAKRQLIEKQKAEMKNLKLKEALEDQLKIAKSLEKVLKKRPSATLSTQVLDSVQVVNSKRFCSLSRSEANIYDMLIVNTEKVYAELNDVVARNEYMQLNEDINDTKLMVDSSNQLYMEITHAKIIPFDLATVIDGVWRCLSLAHVPIADGSYEAVERTDEMICAKATMAINLRNTQATVITRFVMKKFVEEHRVVVACESSTHSEGPRDIVQGLKCLEKGWVVIKPVTSKGDGAPSSTIIQLCMRMTPTISGDLLESQRKHTGAITDLILGSFNKSLVLLYQAVENIIMESIGQVVPTPP